MIPAASALRMNNPRVLLLIKKATAGAPSSSSRIPSEVTRRTMATTNAASTQGYSREDVLNLLNERQELRNDVAYSLSFGEGERAYSLSSMVEPSALMQEQMKYSRNQLRRSSSAAAAQEEHNDNNNNNNNIKTTTKQTKLDNSALPRTLEEVMRQKSRAIVVTETDKPFRIVDVNECWEGLCGYSFTEARGKTLGSLLQGPDTNQVAATGLVAHLLAGEEAGAVLTNYTKEGREFRNRIRVGPLYDESGNVSHFVGVLQEIQEEDKQYM